MKLQGKKEDIVSGLAAIDRCCSELRQLRSNIASLTTRIYAHSCRIAEKSGITVAMPRTCLRQTHRFNLPSSSVEDYFKNTVAIPFLDHLIQDLSERFDSHSKTVALLQGLLPKNINTDTSFQDVEEAVLFYKDDLPNYIIIDEELYRWRMKWLAVPIDKRPQTLTESLKSVCHSGLPNISMLLKLFATIPLSSCSCERSASALRRLNIYEKYSNRGTNIRTSTDTL